MSGDFCEGVLKTDTETQLALGVHAMAGMRS